jgi:hypothetical protein
MLKNSADADIFIGIDGNVTRAEFFLFFGRFFLARAILIYLIYFEKKVYKKAISWYNIGYKTIRPLFLYKGVASECFFVDLRRNPTKNREMKRRRVYEMSRLLISGQ